MRKARRRLVAVVAAVAAVGGPLARPASALASLPVSEVGSVQRAAALEGSRVVFEADGDVYLSDLRTGVTQRLTDDAASQTEPVVCGDRVVWQDARNGRWDLYALDLRTGRLRLLTGPLAGNHTSPSCSGSQVVFQSDGAGNWDVWRADLETGALVPLDTNPADQTRPVISGTLVAYEDTRNGDADIFGGDLNVGCGFPLVVAPGDQRRPAVADELLAWEDDGQSPPQVMARPFRSPGSPGAPLAPSPLPQRAPALASGVAAWQEGEGDGARVVRMALDGSPPQVLAEGSGPQLEPAVDGPYAVWEEGGRLRWTEVSPPQVRLSRPVAGAVYVEDRQLPALSLEGAPALAAGTTLTAEAQASDAASGVASVRFLVDGETACSVSAPPYRCAIPLTFGDHVLEAVAVDRVGNAASQAARLVAVGLPPGPQSSKTERRNR